METMSALQTQFWAEDLKEKLKALISKETIAGIYELFKDQKGEAAHSKA